MKSIIKFFLLVSAFSTFASDYSISTTNYEVDFQERYSDSRGLDKYCSYSVLDGLEVALADEAKKVIRINPVGTGRWIDLEIPKAVLPLKEGAYITIKSITGDKLLTYKNGVLSYKIKNKKDEDTQFYKHGIAKIKVDKNLENVKFLEAQEVTLKKSFFGIVKAKELMSIDCKF